MTKLASIDDALEIAITHFRGVTDKDGEPYIMHCLRVMLGVSDRLAQQVGVLHDVLYRSDRRDSNLKRIQTYLLSYQFLSDRIDETYYRQQMSAIED